MQTLLYSLVVVLLTVGSGFAASRVFEAPARAPREQQVETVGSTFPFSSTQPVSATVEVGDGPRTAQTVRAGDDTAIRPFRVEVPEAALADLRQRIAMTRWPERETVADRSQGAQLARLQDLVGYWGTEYDWRKAEAQLNALPQFMTPIDGLDSHFIHMRSPHPNAFPLIMTRGWPGWVSEPLRVIGPLPDPPAYGGRAEDAFDLVLPSIPGFGFSGMPTDTGWDPDHIARAWA